MAEFRFPAKLIALTKMCMEGMKYQVRIDQTAFEEFQVITGLKQGDALSPLLFNIALEKATRSIQHNGYRLEVGAAKLDVLGFVDNLNLIGNNKKTVVNNIATLIDKAKTVGLTVNQEKTKVMELLGNDHDIFAVEGLVFEKVNPFKYLGATIKSNNAGVEIVNRIHRAEKAYYKFLKFFKSKLFLRSTKLRLYTAVVRPTLTYGCEVWTITAQMEKRLLSFENKVLRRICSAIYDNELRCCCRRTNAEIREITKSPKITNYIKAQ
jgi:hypothetical protein